MEKHEPGAEAGSKPSKAKGAGFARLFGTFAPRAGGASERREAEQRLRLIVDAAPTAMLVANERGLITLVNAQTETLFGYPRSALLGRPVEMLIPKRFRDGHAGLREAFFKTPDVRAMGAGRDLYGLRQDGTEVPIEIGLNPLAGAGGSVVASIVDITERKRGEERLRLIVDAAPIAMLMIDEHGKVTLLNTQAERLFDYPREALLGQPIETLIPERFRSGHPHLRDAFFHAPHARFMGVGRDLHGRRRDGSEFPVEVGLNPIEMAEGRSVVASIIDISERKKIENLQAAVDAAEAATRAKSDFLATMSHELRTPITGILGAIDLLRTDPTQADQKVLLDALQTSARTLSIVVGDILDFSKIEAGHIGLEAIDFDLHQVVRGAIQAAGSIALGKGLKLELCWPGAQAHVVRGDPTRLRQVLSNLIDNALKFTTSGSVSVTVDPPGLDEADRWRFSVRDTGMGIEPDARERLFAPFMQADQSTTRRFGGTGLGLVICKRLAEAMGGEIGVESNLGEGSIFWFTVRLAPGHVSLAAAVSVPDPFRSATRSLRVLLAEDNAVSQLLVGKMLERMGHVVTCVANGRLALEAASAGGFDVVLMDMQMPEMDGVQATKSIRELTGPVARVAIIALTADALIEHRATYESAGLTDFLTKPVDPGTLRAALDRVHDVGAAAPFPEAEAFDQERLAMLRVALGDDEIIELLRVFADNVSDRIAAARVALDTRDRVTFQQNVHSIKGAAANLGALEVAADALALERAIGADGDLHAPFERMAGHLDLAVRAARKAAGGGWSAGVSRN